MSAAERQRRHRDRVKRGICMHKVECSELTFAALEAAGLLHPSRADETSAIEEALNLVLRDWERHFFP